VCWFACASVEAGEKLRGWETHGISTDCTETTKSVKKFFFNLKHLIETFIVQYYGDWE
jgi:hypothetical protein